MSGLASAAHITGSVITNHHKMGDAMTGVREKYGKTIKESAPTPPARVARATEKIC
jgi:hypothetical protein